MAAGTCTTGSTTLHETMCVELERQECAIEFLKFEVIMLFTLE